MHRVPSPLVPILAASLFVLSAAGCKDAKPDYISFDAGTTTEVRPDVPAADGGGGDASHSDATLDGGGADGPAADAVADAASDFVSASDGTDDAEQGQ